MNQDSVVRTDPAARTRAEIEEFLAGGAADSLRVTLRPLTGDDQDEYIELVRASTGLHHPWMSLPATPQDFQTFLRRLDHDTSQGLKVCLRDSGAMAGVINISSIIRGRFQSGSIAYAAFAPTAGQGYMSEGLGLVVRYAFEQLRLHRLEANIQPGNRPSQRLAERQGFRREGYSPGLLFIDGAWRDHERWGLTTATPERTHPSLPVR